MPTIVIKVTPKRKALWNWIAKKRRANASNFVFVVFQRTDVQCPKAILSQELFEANTVNSLIAIIKYSVSKRAKQLREVLSHEIETQAAAALYSVDIDEYRKREAQTMVAGYDFFKSCTAERIEKEMKKVSEQAKKEFQKISQMKQFQKF